MVYLFGTICLVICVVLVKFANEYFQHGEAMFNLAKEMFDYNRKANDNLYTALGIKPKEVEDGN